MRRGALQPSTAPPLPFPALASSRRKHTISALAFNAQGSHCAYAASYDYHRGVDGMASAPATQLFMHQITQEDLQGKPAA